MAEGEAPKSETTKAVRSTEAAKKINKIMKDFYARAQAASQEGRPVAWCMAGIPPEILNAMHVESVFPENFGTVSAATQTAVPFIEKAEGDAFSVDICSYARIGLGFAARLAELGGKSPPEAARGGMAYPSMFICPSLACDPRYKWFHAFKRYLPDVPLHVYDYMTPSDDVDVRDPHVAQHYIEHNLDQLRSLVAFMEKVTGARLDKKALAYALDKAQEAEHYYYEANQLRKAVPSPMPSQDFFALIAPSMYMRGTQEVVDFFRDLRDEVKDRVEKGIGVIPVEKYRLLWGGIPMWFNMGIFNYFESLGAVFAIETTYGHGYETHIEVDEKDPVKSLAEWTYWTMVETNSEGPEAECGTRQADRFMEYIRDYAIDGVVMHTTRSCRAVSIGQQHTRNVLKNYLQVPSMLVETDMGDARTYSDAQVKMRINAFMETLEAVKEGVSLEDAEAAAGAGS